MSAPRPALVIEQAIDLLEHLPHSLELSFAYCTRSLLDQTAHDLTDAIASARQAVALAEPTGSPQAVARALTMLGRAEIYLDYDAGRRDFDRARDIAALAGLDATLVSIFANLGSTSVELFHLEQAELTLNEGLAYAGDRDFDRMRRYMLAWMAMVHLYRGQWAEAATAATEVLRSPRLSSNGRWAALLALGRLAARRGGAGMPQQLDEALALASKTGDIQLLGPFEPHARKQPGCKVTSRRRAPRPTRTTSWRCTSAMSGSPASLPSGVGAAVALALRRLGCSPIPVPDRRRTGPLQPPGGASWAARLKKRARWPMEICLHRHQALLTFDALGAQTAAAELRRRMRGGRASRECRVDRIPRREAIHLGSPPARRRFWRCSPPDSAIRRSRGAWRCRPKRSSITSRRFSPSSTLTREEPPPRLHTSTDWAR